MARPEAARLANPVLDEFSAEKLEMAQRLQNEEMDLKFTATG